MPNYTKFSEQRKVVELRCISSTTSVQFVQKQQKSSILCRSCSIPGNYVSSIQQTYCHIFSISWITFYHLATGLKTSSCYIINSRPLMKGLEKSARIFLKFQILTFFCYLGCRCYWSVGDQREVYSEKEVLFTISLTYGAPTIAMLCHAQREEGQPQQFSSEPHSPHFLVRAMMK